MTIKTVLKKVFAPRKVVRRSVKVTLPAPSREDWLASLRQANTQAVFDFLKAVEDFAATPDIEGESDSEYNRMVCAAKVLGFPEVENFEGEANMALVAAMQYHSLRSDTLSDTNIALSRIATAVKAIGEEDGTPRFSRAVGLAPPIRNRGRVG